MHRPQNIPNILANGLDPNRRGASSGQRLGSGEYFGTHAEVSTEYCGGGRQMIVFAVGTCVEITSESGSRLKLWGQRRVDGAPEI